MTVSDKLRCRITEDLPGEMAARVGKTLQSGDASANGPTFSGVSLTLDGRLVAALGFGLEPGGTLAITAPVFVMPAATEILSTWFGRMLDKVSEAASQRRCRLIRCLRSVDLNEDRFWMATVLKDREFSIRARIVHWVTAETCVRPAASSNPVVSSNTVGFPEAISYRQLSTAGLNQDAEEFRLLLELVESILTKTQDLRQFSDPVAEDLLADWSARNASVVIAEQDAAPIALSACVIEPSGAFGKFDCRVQYIGVRPTSRRQGIASGMLTRLPSILNSPAWGDGNARVQISAFADHLNEPAAALYRRTGFSENGSFDAWCKDLP